MVNKKIYSLLAVILILISVIPCLLYEKYQSNRNLEVYSYEQVIENTVKPKNIPLVEELYRLGSQVTKVKDLKSKEITDPDQKKTHILLSKICKDSCLPVRCRIDPGLGQACRINCPAHKIKFCVTSLKPFPKESNSH